MASTLDSLITVEAAPSALPPPPAKAVARTYPGAPQGDDGIELAPLQRPVPESHNSDKTSPMRHNGSGDDLEMSRPGTPTNDSMGGGGGAEVEAMQSLWEPYMNRFRLLAMCLMLFGNGLNDSAPGPLIPYMEKYYNIGYGTVSLIFVGNAFGFIAAALVLDTLREKLGRGRLLALTQTILALGYVPIVTNAPFPALVVGFFLIGFAMGFTVALGSLFCGTLHNATFAMGVLHGCYGVGGTVGPLVATALVNAAGEREWSKFYFLTQALAICTAGFGCWAFWSYESEQSSIHEASARLRGDNTDAAETASVQGAKLTGMFTALASRVVLLGAIFIFAYQGAEVSISGWVISFLITTRDGNPANVGYVTAGFWAGITLGRFLLTAPAQRIGEKTFVYFLVGGAIIFQALVWSVPNVIGDAVAVSLVGLLLGPVYPCAATVFMRSLSRKERLNGMGVISAFGSSGGAAAPFTTGIIAQAVGTFVLHPIAIALFAVMLGCWFYLPDSRKRRE